MNNPTRIPLQVAFLTGQSRPPGAALTPAQAAFLEALPLAAAGRVPVNFPYPGGGAGDLASASLLVASVRNARQYLSARRAGFASRHDSAVAALLVRAERTLFLAGSCGLELFNGLALSAEMRRRVTIFAYGPVARRRPDCDAFFVQGRHDWLSRRYFRAVDARVETGHLDYLANPTVFTLAADLVRRLSAS